MPHFPRMTADRPPSADADRLARVNAFLHAYWTDDVVALARLALPDFIWDNVSYHQFSLDEGQLRISTPLIRRGITSLGSKSRMLFRDAVTGEPVPQDRGVGGHEILGEAVAPDGTVYQERYDVIGLRGTRVRMRCVGVFTFAGNCIAEWRDLYDFAHWGAQLALLGLEYAGYETDAAA